jgi:hypothetical protein
MSPEDLSLLQRVSELLNRNDKETAYKLTSELIKKYSQDPQLLLWHAYACPILVEAQTFIKKSQNISPENPALANAKNWLRGESQKHFQSTRRPHEAEMIIVLAEFSTKCLGYVYCAVENLYLIEPKPKGFVEIISYKDIAFTKYATNGYNSNLELQFFQRKKLIFSLPVEEASVLSGFINLKIKSNPYANFGLRTKKVETTLPLTVNSEVGVKLKYLDKLGNYEELLNYLKQKLPKWNISKSLFKGAIALVKLRILIKEASNRNYSAKLLYSYERDADATADFFWSVADRLSTFTVVGVNPKALEEELKPLQKEVENRTEIIKQTYVALSKMLLKEAIQISDKQWFDREF